MPYHRMQPSPRSVRIPLWTRLEETGKGTDLRRNPASKRPQSPAQPMMRPPLISAGRALTGQEIDRIESRGLAMWMKDFMFICFSSSRVRRESQMAGFGR